MSSIKKVHVNSAVSQNGGFSRLDLSRKALVTAKIGQIIPIFHQECVPGDKFRLNSHMFARFAPLAVPSYINLKYRTLSCFVPYHQVFDGAESYFSNQSRFRGKGNDLPKIPLSAIQGVLTRTECATEIGELIPAEEIWDIKFGNTFYKFKPLGRYIKKLLDCLGYRFGKTFLYPSGSATLYLNALPLLAFAHAYNSFLSYSVNYNTSDLTSVLEGIKRRANVSNNNVSGDDLFVLLSSILLTYEDSFLTSSWAHPYNTNDNTAFKVKVFDAVGSEPDVTFNNDIGAFGGMSDGDALTSSQIRLIARAEDYFRRNGYAGSKDVDAIFSRFGIKIDDYHTRYPYYLNETSQSVSVGDVTATAATDDVVVGDYAGKAIANGDARFDFSSNDYGMLFTFAWFAPDALYAEGMDKECLRVSPFDFYTPEFDNGFASAIPQLQVTENNSNDLSTFGYCPLYSEYLYAKDMIAGDFSRFVGFDAWHFGRTDLKDKKAQTDNLIYLPNTGTQFERIFNIVDPELVDADTIYITCDNRVDASRPMRDYSGKTLLGDGSLDLQLNGSQIN